MKIRYPSIACTPKQFEKLLMWMTDPLPTYEIVNWKDATVEDMELWRQKFEEMQKALT